MTQPRTRRLAIAILGSLVVVLVVASGALFFQGGDNQPVRIILPTPGASSDGTSALDESSRRSQGGSELRVYISGAVRKPGVYLLNQGDRLEDALAAAGGGTSEADLNAVNLALRVQDEAHYRVPSIGETLDSESNSDSGPETSQDAPSDTGQSSDGLIDLNSASVELLETLPGIGPVRAKAIVADRKLNGPFLTVEQVTRVAGVGAGTYISIRDLVSVDGSR
jgi:competence protein ComEA